MGQPAAVMGDQITATCPLHLIPNPATGIPQPGAPMPFTAPITVAVATRTLIAGRPAAVVGSSGLNTPPHVGVHPADPFMLPTAQVGTVSKGSLTVLIEGRPAARTGDIAVVCMGLPGTIVGTAATVLIGG